MPENPAQYKRTDSTQFFTLKVCFFDQNFYKKKKPLVCVFVFGVVGG